MYMIISKRLHGQVEPKGCILHSGGPPGLFEFPTSYLARASLSVLSSTARTQHSAMHIYKTTRTKNSVPSHPKCLTSNLPRRHTNHRFFSGSSTKTYSPSDGNASKLGVYNQPREFSTDALLNARISRVLNKFSDNKILFTLRQDSYGSKSMQILNEGEPNLVTSPLQAPRVSCHPAVWIAALHFRHLQNCLIRQVALNDGSYQGTVLLDTLALEELQWCITNIKRVNGSPICPPTTGIMITSDALKWDGVLHATID